MSVCLDDCQPGRTVRSIAVVLLVLQAIDTNAEAEESALERHQRAIRDVGQYVENMNDRWFATAVTKKYHAGGDPYTQERQAVVYYSRSLLYINSQEWFTSSTKIRAPEEHLEFISTDAWTILIDHNHIGRNGFEVDIAEGRTPAALHVANSVRVGNDITSWFDTRVKRIAAHEFSEPRLDKQGRLVVRLDRSSYVNVSDTERMRKYPILDLVFSPAPEVRPSALRSFIANEEGSLIQTSSSNIRYMPNIDGKPILHGVRYETSLIDEPQEVFDIQVREIPRPEWCEWPPRISIPTGQLEVQRYSDTGVPGEQVSDLPIAAAPLIQRCDEVALRERLKLQRKNLGTIRDFVMAVPLLAPDQTFVADVTPINPDVKTSYSVPLALGGVAICIFVCWLVVWYRWRSTKL